MLGKVKLEGGKKNLGKKRFRGDEPSALPLSYYRRLQNVCNSVKSKKPYTTPYIGLGSSIYGGQ